MAEDGRAVIPSFVLRTLEGKSSEKRQKAAAEVQRIVNRLTFDGEHGRITAFVHFLTEEYLNSSQTSPRKIAGMLGLSAVAAGLMDHAPPYLKELVSPILNLIIEDDKQVRYFACEALFNIIKVVRGEFIIFFNQVFDALCKLSADTDEDVQNAVHLLDNSLKEIATESYDQFSLQEFIFLLKGRMESINSYVRQFLVGWIVALDGCPEIDLYIHLPDFLDGLFVMLSDSVQEVRQQVEGALTEFLQTAKDNHDVDFGRLATVLVRQTCSTDDSTRLLALIWINEFVKRGVQHLVPYIAHVLRAVLPCLGDEQEKIRVVACEINEKLHEFPADPAEGFDIEEILSTSRRELNNEHEAPRVEASRWITELLTRHRTEIMYYVDEIADCLFRALSDPSDQVVLLALEAHACIARDSPHFHRLISTLVRNFRSDHLLLEKRGSLIVRRLCVLLDAEQVYREFAMIIKEERNLGFAGIIVQALNVILLTTSELIELRGLLKKSSVNAAGMELFLSLYSAWCRSATATISLCLFAQAYNHANCAIQSLVEEEVDEKFLVQLDKLIRLLETPCFVHVRMKLLEPEKCPGLLKSLYGLLMLLPQQSAAFKMLWKRLKAIPFRGFHQLSCTSSADQSAPSSQLANGSNKDQDEGTVKSSIDFHFSVPKISAHTSAKLCAGEGTDAVLQSDFLDKSAFLKWPGDTRNWGK